MKTSTTKKRNLLFAVFYIGKNIFPRFVFDFLHCNLPFCTRGLAEVFCCKLFASGNGQALHINNTLHRPSDKNHYCKNCFCMLCTSDKIAFFRFDGQACVKPQCRQRNLKRLHGKRFACKRQRNFCASKNCTPNCLSDKYAFFRVKNLSLLQRRQGTVGTHCDYLNTSARPASFNFSLSLTTVFSSLLGRSAFC